MILYQKKIKADSIIMLAGFVLFVGAFVWNVTIGFNNLQDHEELPEAELVVRYAYSYLLGNENMSKGIEQDCSGFVQDIFRGFNIDLPAGSKEIYKFCKPKSLEIISTGDLLFFNVSGNGISHVALAIDSSRFIHSPGIGRIVRIDSLSAEYWDERYVAAARVQLSD